MLMITTVDWKMFAAKKILPVKFSSHFIFGAMTIWQKNSIGQNFTHFTKILMESILLLLLSSSVINVIHV